MNQKDFGLRISNARKERKITQEKLAELLGVSNRTVSRWENGQNMPDISLLPKISEILEVSIFEMLGGSEEIKKENVDSVLKKTINKFSKQEKLIKFNKIIIAILVINLLIMLGFFARKIYLDKEYLFKNNPDNINYNELGVDNDIIAPLSYNDFYTKYYKNNKIIGLEEGVFSKLPLYDYKKFTIIVPNKNDIQYTLGAIVDNKKYGYSEDEINKTYNDNHYTKKAMYIISAVLFNKIYNLETVTFHFSNQYYQIKKDDFIGLFEFRKEDSICNDNGCVEGEILIIRDYETEINSKLNNRFLDIFIKNKKIDF